MCSLREKKIFVKKLLLKFEFYTNPFFVVAVDFMKVINFHFQNLSLLGHLFWGQTSYSCSRVPSLALLLSHHLHL